MVCKLYCACIALYMVNFSSYPLLCMLGCSSNLGLSLISWSHICLNQGQRDGWGEDSQAWHLWVFCSLWDSARLKAGQHFPTLLSAFPATKVVLWEAVFPLGCESPKRFQRGKPLFWHLNNGLFTNIYELELLNWSSFGFLWSILRAENPSSQRHNLQRMFESILEYLLQKWGLLL